MPDPEAEPEPVGDRASRWYALAPYAIVTLVALFMTRAFWVPGRFVVTFDTFAYSGPHLEVTERAVRDLRIPQVNDLIFGGVPQLGNPQVGAWYPAHLLTLLFETNRAMGLMVALHVVVLGLGIVLLARRLGVGRVGATVAGVATVSSGAVLVKSTQFEQILGVAWAPMLLVSIHAVLHDERPWAPMAATAATTAAVLVAGHPQMAFQTIVLSLAATIGFAVGGARWRRLPHLAGGVVLGALIAAPPLSAALAATSDSAIDLGRSLEELRSPALSADTSALLRAMLGTPQDIEPGLFSGGFESIGFVGVAVALLAVIGAVRAIAAPRTRPWAISFALFAVLGLLWSTGPRSVLFRVAYDVVPGFDLARGSARWLVMVVLVVAVFAGIGVDAVVARARSVDVVAAAAAVAVVAVLALTDVVDTFAGRTTMIWAAIGLIVITAVAVVAYAPGTLTRRVAGAAILAVLALELGLMSRNSLPEQVSTGTAFTAHRSDATDWLIGRPGHTIAFTDDGGGSDYMVPGLRPNANALASIRSIDGYDGGVQVTERWATALYRFTPDPLPTLPLRNSLPIPVEPEAAARLGVRYMLLDNDRPASIFVPGWDGPLAEDDEFGVFENPAWIGEAVAWRSAEPVDSDRAAADLLRTVPHRYGDVALVDDPAVDVECASTDTCDPVGLAVERPNPEHLRVRTSSGAPTIVMVTQQALPGWSVTVDGVGADELVVDGLFLGVEVPAGDHVVEWRYRSPLLAPAVLLSLIAAVTTVVLAVRDRLSARMGRLRPDRRQPA